MTLDSEQRKVGKLTRSSQITDNEIVEAAIASTSMRAAARALKFKYDIFRKRAIELGCFKPNQSGKGVPEVNPPWNKVPLAEILNGDHPTFQTFKLKHRLISEGLLENCCSDCGIREWKGKNIQCELDHIDGNRYNHRIMNLRMLCPNCHSQTATYRGKNKGSYEKK